MQVAFSRHELRRPKEKGPGDLRSPEPAPLARRRPGYSSSGCTPAEPDSASPGKTSITQVAGQAKFKGKSETTVSSRRGLVRATAIYPGGSWHHRGTEGSSRYQASTDRQWAKTDSGASGRRPDTDRR